jgi:3-hydroxyisobutyrate dehydrogenase
MKVAVAGLGMVGGGVARGLVASGYEVAGYDVRAEAFEQFDGLVEVAGTATQVGETADILFVAVYDDAQLRELLSASDGVLAARRPPRVIIILSTVTLDTVRWAAAEGARFNASVLDCGVSGGTAVERREMVTMIGGDADAVEMVRPYLASFSSASFHMGPLGSGMQAKIARNMYHYATRVAAWEGVRLAAAAGIDPHVFVDLVKACARASGPFDLFDRGIGWPTPSIVDEETRRSAASYAHKDLKLSFELGDELGVDLPAARLTDELYDAAVELA